MERYDKHDRKRVSEFFERGSPITSDLDDRKRASLKQPGHSEASNDTAHRANVHRASRIYRVPFSRAFLLRRPVSFKIRDACTG